MKNKDTNKATGEDYYALLCYYSTDNNPLICGVYTSRREAKEVAEKVKECNAKHKIMRCSVKINY